jgi:3-oxoacyl-[acyl-carrier protein] reductase
MSTGIHHQAADLASPALTGRRVLVTGASSGLGAEIARALATSGASVAINARRSSNAARVRDQLTAQGARAVIARGDFTEPASAQQAVDRAVAALGGLDGLVSKRARHERLPACLAHRT